MGQWDCNNYIVEVRLRDNISDQRYDSIREKRPSVKDFKQLEKEFFTKAPVYSKKAEDIIRFFLQYKTISLRPDKWNYWEPVNKTIDYFNISELISGLASPGGGVYLEKKHSFEIEIKNHTHSFIWEDDLYLEPKRALPEYLTTIIIYFDKKKKIDLDAIIRLMRDIKTEFGADNGRVYYQATGEIIAE